MRDLKVGDRVLVSSVENKYEPVYSFGHYDPETSSRAKFLRFEPSGLTLSRDHMVSVKDVFVPAGLVKVGDILLSTNSEEAAMVTAIRTVKVSSIFAPFTPSRMIIVNGVVSSNYVAFPEVYNSPVLSS